MVVVDHVEIQCLTAPGVGARLLWTVVVANQSSTNPRTGYMMPQLSAVAVSGPSGAVANDSVAMNSLATDGTDTLVFTGRYFGPASALVEIVATGR